MIQVFGHLLIVLLALVVLSFYKSKFIHVIFQVNGNTMKKVIGMNVAVVIKRILRPIQEPYVRYVNSVRHREANLTSTHTHPRGL